MKRAFLLVACVWFAAFSLLRPAGAEEAKRIAYFEAGPFWLFNQNYRAFQNGLAKLGEFKVVYPPELHFSPGWRASPGELDAVATAIQRRGDVDLIVAAGTAAVRAALRRNQGKIPIIGIALADPIAAGVVESADDSGADNFTTDVIVDRWKQMLRVFHDVVNFSTLGIIYPAGPEGRIYSGLADAQAVGAELGFKVLAREMPGEETADCAAGLKWLHENGADAFFIGPLTCFDWEQNDPEPLLRQLNLEYRMPTFARDGSIYVQGGALMGFATWDFTLAGMRHAQQATAIFRSAKPRDLPMRATVEPLIAINFQTAREIGFDFPFDVLLVADEIYVTTSRPKIE